MLDIAVAGVISHIYCMHSIVCCFTPVLTVFLSLFMLAGLLYPSLEFEPEQSQQHDICLWLFLMSSLVLLKVSL